MIHNQNTYGLLIALSLLWFSHISFAQSEAKVVWKVEKDAVVLKWFRKDLLSKNGVYIKRRDLKRDEVELLTPLPLVKPSNKFTSYGQDENGEVYKTYEFPPELIEELKSKYSEGDDINVEDIPELRAIQKLFEAYHEDPTLEYFVSLVETIDFDKVSEIDVDNTSTSPSATDNDTDLNGYYFLQIFMKSVQSEVFADYLGIMFRDETARKNREYIYEVWEKGDNSQKLIAITDTVSIKDEVVKYTPTGLEIEKEAVEKGSRFKANLVWDLNDKAFYAVNIYRREKGEKDFKKLNRIKFKKPKTVYGDIQSTDSVEVEEDIPIAIFEVLKEEGTWGYPDVFYTDTSTVTGKSYEYKIEGLDYFNEPTNASQIVEIAINDDKAPYGVQTFDAKNKEQIVTIQWIYDKERRAKDFAGFKIYRLRNDENRKVIHNSLLDVNLTEYTDSLKQYGFYQYAIATVDFSGNESFSRNVKVAYLDKIPPSKVVNLKVSRKVGVVNNQTTKKKDKGKHIGIVQLEWENPVENNDLIGFWVYRSLSKKAPFVLLNSNVQTQFFKDTLAYNIKNELSYRVIAVDSSFNKSETTDAQIQLLDIKPPSKPFIKKVVVNQEKNIEIHWLPVFDRDMKAYHLYRKTLANKAWDEQPYRIISKGNQSFVDSSAYHGNVYIYALKAIDETGNISPFSEEYQAKGRKSKEITKPSISRVRYNNKKKKLEVSWKAEDTELLLGYKVFIQKDNGGITPISGMLKEKSFKTEINLSIEKPYVKVKQILMDGTIYESELSN